ncbi:flagellar hook-associated protein FlgL [Cellulosilyticum lentocellum]|uniref:Flagellar hook-associated protein 3 n=1 Tax=Cellulosilyticum lentocellum (strain ATCC 49066 / DSM 5427 / NCIMB 11756 / RHM5) TaxID=642492 RepID=F2JT58_CELLD|nr:flagellar hook-associated protein FlgL [Cellulosilyticum lentocellum]ADZ85277.1 flagellar hook-associated protein 3 [Cellulosilyticum lentocellum DSM 5427]
MRVTNGMIRNNTLNNLYKNISAVNQSFAQMSTGKKIQTVSDDPIIAGRAIKLKVNVLETQQYQKNAKEARSWMEVTETSMDNMNKILESIRTKCVQASTGTLEEKDKAVIKTDIMQLWEQLQEEANVTYGGRYVYSGYKTSEPLMLNKDLTLEEDLLVEKEYTVSSGTTIAAGSILAKGSTVSKADRATLGITDAMLDADGKLGADFTVPTGGTTLKGELTLSENSKLASGSTVTAGNINPKVYNQISGQEMRYEVGTGNTITVNTLGMDDTFNNLLQMMEEIVTTVDSSLEAGSTITSDDLHNLFNDKIGEIDEVLADISTKTADLGSRMARLDYVDSRLTDNNADYKELLSNTEDIDVEEVYVEFNSRYATYTAALQATSKVIMNTLADYL